MFFICDQFCIDTCVFQYDLHSNFSLPTDCNITRQDTCFVLTTFDYANEIIQVSFNSEDNQQNIKEDYTTDNTIRSTINLADPSFIKYSVEYFCSTGDQCDLDYVEKFAIPLYTQKSCEKFRSQLIQYLNPTPSLERNCFDSDNTTLQCNRPCEFIYDNPQQITRSCNGELSLIFETIIGQSTPTNKPEYEYRTWNFACTTSLCNGIEMQQRIENLIDLDNGECLSSFNQSNETTTTTTTQIPSKSISTFSKSYYLIIFIIYIFLSLTFFEYEKTRFLFFLI